MASITTGRDTTKSGSLIIAGSGISSVAHLTLETVSHLKNADNVFYLVGDPVTEAFIQENNKSTTNLVAHYATSKHRYQTYVEMAEVMLREVRAGHSVFGIFYGHPGVLTTPAHRALTLARQEGYEARMLPGVSSVDYMFADLELEPGQHGCMIHEATDLLARDRRLDPSVHNIILQPSRVGSATLEKEASKFQLLVDRLVRDFGPDHKIVHYSGAVLPQSSSAMVVFVIENLRNEQLANQIRSTSILYIPPRDIVPVHPDAAAALKLPDMLGLLSTSVQWVGPRFIETADYGPVERKFVDQLERQVIPEGQQSLRASTAMRKFMINLALDPNGLKEYKESPSAVAAGVPGLTDRERSALAIASEGPIFVVMSRTDDEEPTEEQLMEADRNGARIVDSCTMCTLGGGRNS
ncbi:tetrapyrrole methylase [Ceratobasidium sp. AG-I]|nr:tetrapyrrole methylase [Ceratobasidium sp. AG-I]